MNGDVKSIVIIVSQMIVFIRAKCEQAKTFHLYNYYIYHAFLKNFKGSIFSERSLCYDSLKGDKPVDSDLFKLCEANAFRLSFRAYITVSDRQ